MSILKDLPELINAGVISQDVAANIESYYKKKSSKTPNKLVVVFGILGAILVGLGIILIVAHNWDGLSRSLKTFFAFLPLLIGHFFCLFTLLKKPDSMTWRESASVFLFFAVGASISLVSQIYHIPGELSAYMLTWMVLCLPIIYVMKSSVVSLLYFAGITYYAGETSYWNYPNSPSYPYWGMFLLVQPYYYSLLKKTPESNFTYLHNWMIPLSLIITLGTLSAHFDELMFVAYISLFGLIYLIGESKYFLGQFSFINGYRVLGSLGTIITLLIVSFDDFWEHLRNKTGLFDGVFMSQEFLVSVTISLLALVALLGYIKNKSLKDLKPISLVFLIFIPVFIIGNYIYFSTPLVNILIFLIALHTIRIGSKQNHLGILNYGLLIITALVICRFFDTDLSFVLRGILFVVVGLGFFLVNYWMLKKRKANE